jgi:DNA-directed RNA polymerase subunit RPC12/RpoP
MHDQGGPGRGWEIRASLVCTLCARLAGTANGPHGQPFVATSIHLVDSSHTEAVRHLRCPYCSGRLWLQDHQEVHVARHVLTGDDLRPRRGRPRKVLTAS